MKTLTLASFALALMAGTALAAPDCSNVATDNRLAGCNGLPDFAVVTSMYENGRKDDGRDARVREKAPDEGEGEGGGVGDPA